MNLTQNLQSNSEEDNSIPKPYRTNKIRFLVLVLLSITVVGNQYAFNNPQALQDQLEADLKISEEEYELFYTVFAFPNIFATFIIGFLIDYLGVRVGLISLATGVAFFQFVIAMGGYGYSYATILIGRVLFGLASQSLITAQASMVSFWFKGKELAFALGIATTFPELGNALNSWLTPQIYVATNSLGTPLLVSVFFCLISLGCAFAAAYLDKKADNEDEINDVRVLDNLTHQIDNTEREEIKLADLKKLSSSFWLIVVLCMCAVSLYVPFLDGADRLFEKRFCFTTVTSGRALVITYLVAALGSAPLGFIIDKVGFKRYFIIATFSVFLFAQAFILIYPQCDSSEEKASVVGLAFIGLGYCFYGNCIISSIPLVVRKKVTGTAFGIMQMIESIALAFFPLITGALVDHAPSVTTGYVRYSAFFVCVAFIGLFLSLLLFWIPDKMKQKLDNKSKDDKIIVQSGFTSSQAYTIQNQSVRDDQSEHGFSPRRSPRRLPRLSLTRSPTKSERSLKNIQSIQITNKFL